MENVPWHEEVVNVARAITDRIPGGRDYELSNEHEHSNCVLVSHKKFRRNGKWHTWIDYERFHELVALYDQSNVS